MPPTRRLIILLVCWLAPAAGASAQVLITGETGGAGGRAVVVTANLIHPNDYGTLKNFWGEYSYGLADRVDVFASYGKISVYGETQHYVGVGSNIGILRRAQSGLDVSFFNNASIPFTRGAKPRRCSSRWRSSRVIR